jgi:hypothetical protein
MISEYHIEFNILHYINCITSVYPWEIEMVHYVVLLGTT